MQIGAAGGKRRCRLLATAPRARARKPMRLIESLKLCVPARGTRDARDWAQVDSFARPHKQTIYTHPIKGASKA